MTCIIAIKHENGVLMGADSLVTTGDECTVLKQKKIFKKGKYLIGVCGRLRTTSILLGANAPPEINNGNKTTYKFMIREFMPWLRKTMSEAGFERKKDEVKEMVGSWLIVAIDNEIYHIDTDYSLYQSQLDFSVEGSGAPYAKGVLYQNKNINVKEKIKKALEAAEYFSAGVRRPFYYINLKENK